MAKGKYEYWLSGDGLLLLAAWARDGLTDEDIAARCGVVRSTLALWKDKYPNISDALKRGKEIIDYEVENALLNKALNGDTTAQIFWLKNRKPKAWRDKSPEGNDDAMAAIRALIESNREAARSALQHETSGCDT